MFMAFFSWWYGAGWRRQGMLVSEQLAQLLDTFSFRLLLKTLFSPFRQISAGSVGGPLGVQLQAWFDRTISRFIGAMVRLFVMVAGAVVIILSILVGIFRIGLWPLLPTLPLFVLVVWLAGGFTW
ncbi:hypothetical protein H7Y40_00795 [Pedobacter sp.]|nr:hypothetical protein [Candidatus Saccharibacteria bacterium]